MIHVKVIGPLKKYLSHQEGIDLRPTHDILVDEAKRAAGIPPATQTSVVVNGRVAKLTAKLKDGDEVIFFSPMSGG